MENDADPSVHRQRQQTLVAHVEKLLEDDRLRIETSSGVKPVTAFIRQVSPGDHALVVKQKMIELGLFDRTLQKNMPTGQTLDVTLSQKGLFGGGTRVGQLRLVCASPTESLLQGETPQPLDEAGVQRALAAMPPPLGRVPQTVVLVSTSGFSSGALAMAERRPDRTLVLVGANEAGGWDVTAPEALADIARLFDPETNADKRKRVVEEIESSGELLVNGVAADRLAARMHVPVEVAESAIREYADRHPGLAAKSIEGTLVLYQEGLSLVGGSTGENMPFWEKVKGVFAKSESRDKKVSRLAQEKALLAQQRERAYAEIELVEKKESDLTATFGAATPLAQKRIATEISQLRKRVERVQQLVSTIDKKINIIETGVHNLTMEEHLSKEKLESLETVAQASEQVDVGMATLDQLNEQADSVSVVGSEMSMGAQDVLAELQAKFAADEPAKTAAGSEKSPATAEKSPPAKERAVNTPPPIPGERRRVPGAAEPG